MATLTHRFPHLPKLDNLATRFHGAVDWLTELWKCIDRTRTLGLAAETAFWLFLSLVPLAAVAGLVAARLSMDNWGDVAPLLGALPGSARELITGELVKVSSWNQGAVGISSAAVFVWLASSGVHAVFDALELEAGAERPWWKKRLLALATCVALSLAVALIGAIGPGLGAAISWVGKRTPGMNVLIEYPIATRIARYAVGIAIVLGYVAGLYWVGVPRVEGKKRKILPGAIVAVAAETLLGLVYGFYIAKAGDGGAYVAGLAVIGVTMTALYLFSLSLLVGALVNRRLATADTGPTDVAKSAARGGAVHTKTADKRPPRSRFGLAALRAGRHHR